MTIKHLHSGNQSTSRLDNLIKLTSIRSENIVSALHDHLVKGHPLETSALINDVPEKNLKRAVNTLEDAARIVEAIKDEDWAHFIK